MSSGDIIILDAITGSQVAVLAGHTHWVRSLTFSLDGTFLVSGASDKNVKLWDVQTGGVVKTFSGHTDYVLSVSISLDCTTIASGSEDKTIRLWHVQTGDCFCVIDGFNDWVNSVSFYPTNSQLLMSASGDNTVQQWDINGCQIGSTHEGMGIAFSSDGAYFVLWGVQIATIHNSASGVVVTKLWISSGMFQHCCFSPNGKLVVGSVDCTVYIWSITGSESHFIGTLNGHTSFISSLVFSASPISASSDQTVKFWKIGATSTDPVTAGTIPTSSKLSSIKSVSLQARDGVAISSDSAGVVKTWDILTGFCKASFQIPVKCSRQRDVRLIEGRLVVVWYDGQIKIYIWDGEKCDLQRVYRGISGVKDIRISGDGSKVFCLTGRSIQARVIQTGEVVGEVEFDSSPCVDPFYMDGSKILVHLEDSSIQGWDFGISGSPILLSNTLKDGPHLNLVGGTRWEAGPVMIKNAITGQEVFQLVGRYAKPTEVQWDGQYLVAGYKSGEVLILALDHVLVQ